MLLAFDHDRRVGEWPGMFADAVGPAVTVPWPDGAETITHIGCADSDGREIWRRELSQPLRGPARELSLYITRMH